MWAVRCHWKEARRAKGSPIGLKLIDERLKNPDLKQGLSSNGLPGALKNARVERMLDAEMDVHLELPTQKAAGNYRHGHGRKTVLSDAWPSAIPLRRSRSSPVHSADSPKTWTTSIKPTIEAPNNSTRSSVRRT